MEGRHFIEQLWMPAFITNGAGRIIAWNRAAEACLGHRSSDITGQYCYHVLCGKDAAGTPYCRKACRLRRIACLNVPVKIPDLWLQGESTRRPFPFKYAVIPICASKRGKIVQMLHLLKPPDARRDAECPPDMTTRAVSRARDHRLTLREREVLRLLCDGRRTAEIAETLFISVHTVRSHIQHILRKMDVHDKLQAILRARRQKLV